MAFIRKRPDSAAADTQKQVGPVAEFDRLLRDHVPALYRYAYRWTGTVERAEDLVQDLLVRLYPRLEYLRGLEQVRPWAVRVMYRIFVDQLRRERRSPVRLAGDLSDSTGSEAESAEEFGDGGAAEPSQLLERHLTQERVLAAWALLGEEHRAVLSMHDIEGYSLVEVSTMIEVPLGTLKSRLHRARARLRELLQTERSGPLDRVADRQTW